MPPLQKFLSIIFVALILAGFGYGPVFRGVASFLIVEDPLQSAAAIVALGGQTPFREIEAARLYREGWAPKVVLVREAPTAESEALRELGVKKVPQWELARAVLIQQGVPASAIVIPENDAVGTLEEVQAVWAVLGARSWVLGVDPVLGVRREASGVRGQARGQKSEVSKKNARYWVLGVRYSPRSPVTRLPSNPQTQQTP